MAENDKFDWSRVDASEAREKGRAAGCEPEQAAFPLAPTQASAAPGLPAEVTIPFPDTTSHQGWVMQWRKNQLDKDSTYKALQAHHAAQLEGLRYHLKKAVEVGNARADLIASRYLAQLNAEYIRTLREIGVDNAEDQAGALERLREMITRKLREADEKNWHPKLKQRHIDDIWDIEARVSAEMKRGLGQ